MDNSIPQPVDVNKLAGILAKAKNVMRATETGNYKTGNIDSSRLVENTENYLDESNVNMNSVNHNNTYQPQTNQKPVGQYNEEMVRNSRLPENIKKAMLENPIPVPNNPIGHTFNLEDVAHLMDDKPMPAPSTPRTRQTVNENYNNSDMITIHKNELKDIVKDVLIEYLTNEYAKNLTETTIKKTINTLIKEGKIGTKKNI
jgi:hypothetical protein